MANNFIEIGNIERDTFIKNNIESDDIFCRISTRDLKNGKGIYKEMQNSLNTRYYIFGQNGQGNTCFALYKSNEQIIYLIHIKIQSITDYTIINEKNEYKFDL
jgi:hypothetical protein